MVGPHGSAKQADVCTSVTETELEMGEIERQTYAD
jgi:hypothetical protein